MDAIEGHSFEDDEVEGSEMPPVKLVDGIDIRELIDTSVATFEVNMNAAEEERDDQTYFNKEELLQCVNFDCVAGDSDEEDDKRGLGLTPFQKIAKNMTDLTPDGKIRKREMKPGSGSLVPEGAYVTVHYNAYVEYGDEPYDSTWLRGQPLSFRLQRGYVIIGLDVAISSMKKGETSRFLIHPDLGYGKMGCPPRIPQNAELLFEVELVKFTDNMAAEAFEALSLEDREKADFGLILKAAQAEHVNGNESFKRDNINLAITKYKKAVNMLEKIRLKNEEEEIKQQNLLLKLYINLAVCYNKQKNSRLACVMSKHALRIQPKNPKALFNFGRALLMLSDFDHARRCLLDAQKLQPSNREISEELKKLDKKQKTYEVDMKKFSQRMFQGASEEDKTESKSLHSRRNQNSVVAECQFLPCAIY
ncbi:inactive peptidyl-prolyl cis-trans isomerase FKBP6-like isoform X2 [Periplaneta americana]|uniref:inactive peptidyl-prolyl cis-trans isomerase FKBP6-like isoform X2 n=1 Tax=Periplaneta americana TaxID=6978 RepID=UPI0037E8B418